MTKEMIKTERQRLEAMERLIDDQIKAINNLAQSSASANIAEEIMGALPMRAAAGRSACCSSAFKTRTIWACAISAQRCAPPVMSRTSSLLMPIQNRSSRRARETDPDVIGLSLIFQYMTPKFADLSRRCAPPESARTSRSAALPELRPQAGTPTHSRTRLDYSFRRRSHARVAAQPAHRRRGLARHSRSCLPAG